MANKNKSAKWLINEIRTILKEELLKETLKSSLLRKAVEFNTKRADSIIRGIAQTYGIAMDQVTDDDVQAVLPEKAYKMFRGAPLGKFLVLWISKEEKENPFTARDPYKYGRNKIPKGLLGASDGKNDFLDLSVGFYTRGYKASQFTGADYKQTAQINKSNKSGSAGDTIGIDKQGYGYGSTQVKNVKRLSEVSDLAIVINIDQLKLKYDISDLRQQRAQAKAKVFKPGDKEALRQIAKDNRERYAKIMREKALQTDIDAPVRAGIMKMTDALTAAAQAGTVDKYNQLTTSFKSSRNSDPITAGELVRVLQSLISDYEGYIRYKAQAKEDAANGWGGNYSEAQAGNYAKSIKVMLDKVNRGEL